jgi:5-methylcytosine-specific restriction endonuclease McrA
MEYDRQRHREGYASGVPAYNRPRKPRTRAEFYGVRYEPIDPVEIFERDGWTCGICREPVDRSLVYPDPQCASLDHIIPWSAGGAHVAENVHCTHLRCNLKKSSKPLDSVLVIDA